MTDAKPRRGYSLPRYVEPYADESLAGLIMRNASLYRFGVPEQMFARLGGPRRTVATWVGVDPGSQEGQALGQLLNLEPERYRQMSNWQPAWTDVSVRGHRVMNAMADLTVRQCCPACLREAAYHRAAWLLTAIPVCPAHRTCLLDACPRCSSPLGWRGGGVHFCSNGACSFDLRKAEAAPVPEELLLGPAGLLHLFDGGAHGSGLQPGDALRASLRLGVVQLGLPRWVRLETFLRKRRSELPAILTGGWSALEPWPQAFHALLEDMLAVVQGQPRKPNLRTAFGNFADRLGDAHQRVWAAPLRAEILRFTVGRTDVVVRSDAVRRHATDAAVEEAHYSLNDAAKLLGVSVDTMTRAARRLGLELGTAAKGEQRLIRGDEVRRLRVSLSSKTDAISHAAAAEMLGLSFVTVRRLVEAGLLARIAEDDRIKARHAFHRADVQRLLDAFERAAQGTPSVAEPGPQHRSVGRGGVGDRKGVVETTLAVLEGRLCPVAVWQGGTGLGRYLFASSAAGEPLSLEQAA